MNKRTAAVDAAVLFCSSLCRKGGFWGLCQGNLLIVMKNLWKKLDFPLLFVRYSFIMNPNSDWEEFALWVN